MINRIMILISLACGGVLMFMAMSGAVDHHSVETAITGAALWVGAVVRSTVS